MSLKHSFSIFTHYISLYSITKIIKQQEVFNLVMRTMNIYLNLCKNISFVKFVAYLEPLGAVVLSLRIKHQNYDGIFYKHITVSITLIFLKIWNIDIYIFLLKWNDIVLILCCSLEPILVLSKRDRILLFWMLYCE